MKSKRTRDPEKHIPSVVTAAKDQSLDKKIHYPIPKKASKQEMKAIEYAGSSLASVRSAFQKTENREPTFEEEKRMAWHQYKRFLNFKKVK